MRIIPKLEIKSGHLVKGRQLEGYRKLGDPIFFAKKYYKYGADEICFVDVVASMYDRKLICDIVKEISKNIFVPFSVGGGIQNFEQVKEIFDSGADKIHINSHLFTDLDFLKRFNDTYGAQSISLEIQTKIYNDEYYCFFDRGRELSNIKLKDWIKKLKNYNFGEIIVTDIQKDGMYNGVNLNLINFVRDFFPNTNLVYSGGFNPQIDNINLLRQKLNGLMISNGLHSNFFLPEDFSERSR